MLAVLITVTVGWSCNVSAYFFPDFGLGLAKKFGLLQFTDEVVQLHLVVCDIDCAVDDTFLNDSALFVHLLRKLAKLLCVVFKYESIFAAGP